MEKIKVAVSGAYGRMGREVCNAILDEEDLELVAAFDLCGEHEDIGEMLGKKPLGISIDRLTRSSLEKAQPGVIVDFTTPMAVINILSLPHNGVRPVVGNSPALRRLILPRAAGRILRLSAIIAPNFALARC